MVQRHPNNAALARLRNSDFKQALRCISFKLLQGQFNLVWFFLVFRQFDNQCPN